MKWNSPKSITSIQKLILSITLRISIKLHQPSCNIGGSISMEDSATLETAISAAFVSAGASVTAEQVSVVTTQEAFVDG